jgi:citronellol/citronellal dehydrogenase
MKSSLFRDDLFRDEVFLITGGGSGIGFNIAEQAGRLGAKIAICGRREEVLEVREV